MTSDLSKFLAVLILASCSAFPAISEELRLETWRGHQVLRLSGPIEAGTAERFAEMAANVPALPHGLPVLLLDSPGGLVDEAMKMSAFMDAHPFHTVVPDGARCASACASILFIAGKNRTVEGSGLLGQHSCAIDGVKVQSCNDLLAENAVNHGVAYGSVAAFVTYTAPQDIAWLSKQDAEGWSLTRYPWEDLSGFEEISPYEIKLLKGVMPAAQSAWRIDFREDGFEAFSRVVSDVEQEGQINLFCVENLPGRVFLAMETTGSAEAVAGAVQGVSISTDGFTWKDQKPTIWQADPQMTEVITEVPRDHIVDLLTRTEVLTFTLSFQQPYKPMWVTTNMAKSGKVLVFAANNCTSGNYSGPRVQLH